MTLLHGDCLELMTQIPDGSVNMVLADLPYGTTRNSWDTPIPMPPLWDHWHRVCKRNAAILLFSQQPFAADLIVSNRKEFRYEWIYEKSNPTGFLNANKMPLKAHENVLVFYLDLPTYNPQYGKGDRYKRRAKGEGSRNYGEYRRDGTSSDGSRFPRSVIQFDNSSWGDGHGYHPTQKPVKLLEYLILTYTNEGETVLDCCMGSGSTGVACIHVKRNFIGIEKDDTYFQTAVERIEREAAQLTMF